MRRGHVGDDHFVAFALEVVFAHLRRRDGGFGAVGELDDDTVRTDDFGHLRLDGVADFFGHD